MKTTLVMALLLGIIVLGGWAAPQGRFGGEAAFAAEQGKLPVEWFRKELGIAPQYQEQSGAILGMSWAHFLSMVFLVAFFVGSLYLTYTRQKRTKELLARFLEGEAKGKG